MKTGFIDWQENSLTLYFFDKRGSRYELSDTSTIPLENGLTAEALSSLVTTEVNTVYLSIPANELTLREQDFPFADNDKISATINYELEGILLGNVHDYTIDHIVIESSDLTSKVLAVCLENSKLNAILETFSTAGLEPKVITSIDLAVSKGNVEGLQITDSIVRAEAAAGEITAPSINLRQGEHEYTGDIERLKKKSRSTAVLILILLIIFASVAVLKFLNVKKENKSLSNQMQTIYQQVFPEDRKIVDLERQFQGNLNSLKKRKAVLVGIPTLDILKDITLRSNRKVTLSEFNADGNTILLRGTAKSFEDVEAVKNNMSSSYSNVKVTNSKSTADKKIDFTIIMKDRSL
jgi:type II secretory pathway component PulL